MELAGRGGDSRSARPQPLLLFSASRPQRPAFLAESTILKCPTILAGTKFGDLWYAEGPRVVPGGLFSRDLKFIRIEF